MERNKANKTARNIMRATKKGRKGKKARKALAKQALSDLLVSMGSSNHPQWYMRLGGQLINLNYGIKDTLGKRIDIAVGPGGEPIELRMTTDAIMVTILSPGSGEALRLSAQKIANELRLVSGSNTIYDVEDIIDFLLNARSIWAGLISYRRALRTLNVKDPYDMDAWVKYTKMALGHIADQGPNEDVPAVFRQDAANTANWLNTMMKAVRYMIPANMDLINRTSWLFDNFFVDTVGKKFGAKCFTLKNLPSWTHTGSTHTGTALSFFYGRDNATSKASLESLIIGFTSNPANIAIAGDMMKAYGMNAFVDMGPVDYEDQPAFIYDEAALHQLQNATPLGISAGGVAYSYATGSAPVVVTPSTGLNIPNVKTIIQPAYWKSKFVNTDDNHILPGETLSLTRLVVKAESTPDSSGYVASVTVTDCGTEVIMDYQYILGLSTGTYNALSVVDALHVAEIGSAAQRKAAITCWSMDDYAPMFVQQVLGGGTPGSTQWEADFLWDVNNWAICALADLQSLHTTAVMSLLTPVASVIMQTVAKL